MRPWSHPGLLEDPQRRPPLHVSSHTIAIHPKQLTPYAEQLLSGPADAIGTMAPRADRMDRYMQPVNILPLVELCTSVPRFKAMIGSSGISSLVWDTKCLEWVEFKPVQLCLLNYTVERFADIDVKEEVPKEYMDKDFKIDLTYALRKDLKSWLNRVGLGWYSERVTVGSDCEYHYLLR